MSKNPNTTKIDPSIARAFAKQAEGKVTNAQEALAAGAFPSLENGQHIVRFGGIEIKPIGNDEKLAAQWNVVVEDEDDPQNGVKANWLNFLLVSEISLGIHVSQLKKFGLEVTSEDDSIDAILPALQKAYDILANLRPLFKVAVSNNKKNPEYKDYKIMQVYSEDEA